MKMRLFAKVQIEFSLPQQSWWLLTCVVFLCSISNGAARKCFVCDSSDNPGCADLKSNSSIVAEECTLDKITSLDTWLFELNKFAYFDTGANKSPLMNCQKIVARDPQTMKMVTARFCQLDTGDSDACEILRSKLRITSDGTYESNGNRRNGKHGQNEAKAEEQRFECSICKTDRCNGSETLNAKQQTLLGAILVVTLLNRAQRRLW